MKMKSKAAQIDKASLCQFKPYSPTASKQPLLYGILAEREGSLYELSCLRFDVFMRRRAKIMPDEHGQ